MRNRKTVTQYYEEPAESKESSEEVYEQFMNYRQISEPQSLFNVSPQPAEMLQTPVYSPRFSTATNPRKVNYVEYIPEEDELDLLHQLKGISNKQAEEWEYNFNDEVPQIEYPPSFAIKSLVLREGEDARDTEIGQLQTMVVRQDEII